MSKGCPFVTVVVTVRVVVLQGSTKLSFGACWSCDWISQDVRSRVSTPSTQSKLWLILVNYGTVVRLWDYVERGGSTYTELGFCYESTIHEDADRSS